jgi:hypothetical protein
VKLDFYMHQADLVKGMDELRAHGISFFRFDRTNTSNIADDFYLGVVKTVLTMVLVLKMKLEYVILECFESFTIREVIFNFIIFYRKPIISLGDFRVPDFQPSLYNSLLYQLHNIH